RVGYYSEVSPLDRTLSLELIDRLLDSVDGYGYPPAREVSDVQPYHATRRVYQRTPRVSWVETRISDYRVLNRWAPPSPYGPIDARYDTGCCTALQRVGISER